MIPFESYNLFYRDGKQGLLKEIQQEIAANTVMRRAPAGAETGASTKVQIQRVAMPISAKEKYQKTIPKGQ
jgi:hypothetical protein